MICYAQKTAKTNKENAAKQDHWQTTGKKPIPVLKKQVHDYIYKIVTTNNIIVKLFL